MNLNEEGLDKLPQDAREQFEDWVSGVDYEVIHVWEEDEVLQTFYLVYAVGIGSHPTIRCARMWDSAASMRDDWAFSVDKEMTLDEIGFVDLAEPERIR